MELVIGGRSFRLGGMPHILGVVNLSPDSPNRDSVVEPGSLLERAAALTAAGAAIIDVGAQSSHYASTLRPVEEEREIIVDSVRRLKAAGYLVSVDTFRAPVVSAALGAGCDIINNSEGLQSREMLEALRGARIPVVVPFVGGADPRRMRRFDLEHPVDAILNYLEAAIRRATSAGITNLLLDPGTGYVYPDVTPIEKERYQERVYEALPRIRALGYPLLVAVPRKPDRARTLDLARRIVAGGADFLRAHDPALAREAVALAGRCH